MEHLADREISIGNFVMSGGELGAALIVDTVTRLLRRALGNEASSRQESFSALKAPARFDERGRARAGLDGLRRRAARLSALHAPGGVSRDGGPGGAVEREPRADPALAQALRAGKDAEEPSRPVAAGIAQPGRTGLARRDRASRATLIFEFCRAVRHQSYDHPANANDGVCRNPDRRE